MKKLLITGMTVCGCIFIASSGLVPEPLTMLLFGAGLIGLTSITRERMKK